MLYQSVLVAAVALVGLTAAAPKRSCDDKCRSNARSILLGRCNNRLLPSGCLAGLTGEAESFCSTFLAPKTVTKTASATTTQLLLFTSTDTATSTATESTTSTTLTVTTATDLATETSTSFTSTSTTTLWVLPTTTTVVPIAPRGIEPISSCPAFNTAHLLALGPSKVSSLCTSLGVKAATTTATATATATTQTSSTSTVTTTTDTTTTAVSLETTLSLTTTTSVTTTTTSAVATATQTLVEDHCGALTYQGYSNTFQDPVTGAFVFTDKGGTESQYVPGTDAVDCCRKCWSGVNCIASRYPFNLQGVDMCLFITITQSLDGTPATPMCPLGADDDLIFRPGPGPFRLGPCAAQSQ